MDVKGKETLVLGIGASGTGAARLLAREGARVRCSDSGAGPDARRRAGALEKIGCRVEMGGHTEGFARGVALAVISPGIDPSIPVVRRLRADGVELISEIELAYAFCDAPVIAVTGTNGKTTTVTLIERILRADGRNIAACGNIGKPFSECVVEKGGAELFVLEVSSFQLEAVRAFRPWIAVALNIAPDHLDRYRTFDDYAAAKAAIFRKQGAGDWAIVKAGERRGWEKRGMRGPQTVIEFSARGEVPQGACVKDDRIVVTVGGAREEICRREELLPGGFHNLENALAAAAAASICGAHSASTRRVFREFRGLPHRMEPAGKWRGISFVNDSKATNPDAVLRALESATGPVVLIAGGRDKGFDYSALRGEILRTVKGLVLIGEAREKMARDLEGAVTTRFAETLGEAVRIAAGQAAPGDTVMLSPACSSYDMFRNYEERGDEFKRIVANMTEENGPRVPASPCALNAEP
ncbi:MAG: UDP-N-acetylmuramoyl-L-alanine--D-glutamate ligase [Chlamydiota bacterium]